MKCALTTAFLLLLAAAPAQAQRAPAPAGPANPFWGNADAVQQGSQLYNQNCTACHGPLGGVGPLGPAILFNLSGSLRGSQGDGEIIATMHNGVPGTVMPSFRGKLAEDDILKIGAYLHALRSNGIDNPLPGDVAHGEEIFWGKGQCGSCHSLSGRGGLAGPDLTTIASQRSTLALYSALTKPQHRILMDGGAHLREVPLMDTYNPVHIVLKNGKTLDGVLLNQDSYSMQVMGSDDKFHHVDRDQVRNMTTKSSLMPTDYDKRLTATEFTDLMAFLTRQGRKAPAGGAGRRGGGGDATD